MAAFLLWAACAPPDPDSARSAWLRDALSQDNAMWLAREPEQLAAKYVRMAADPYDFMRGTPGLWFEDLARPDVSRARTEFVSVPESAAVLLVGDPHPENLGTSLPGEEPDEVDADAPLTIEWVDLDSAVFGPWTLDARRAALALSVLGRDLVVCGDGTEPCPGPMVAAFTAGYLTEIRAEGDARWNPEGTDHDGALVALVREKAVDEGTNRDVLAEFTVAGTEEGGSTERRLRIDETLDDNGKGVMAVSTAELDQVARLLAQLPDLPTGFRLVDAGRRYGSGVSSLPAPRYLVLWDRGDRSDADDRLLNLREVLDPPAAPGLAAGVPMPFTRATERVTEAARLLWSRPDADVRMYGLTDGLTIWKASTVSGWFTTFDHEDIPIAAARAEVTPEDLLAFCRTVGAALAGTHARTATAEGEPALDWILADLDAGGEDAFVEERMRDAEADLALALADYALLGTALEEFGPLLGAGTLPDDAP